MASDFRYFTEGASRLVERDVAFVAITLAAVRGSAPQVVGAKALVGAGGLEYGTVGGGKIEAAAIRHAQELLADGNAAGGLVTWNLQRDIGMTCGGEVQLLFEIYRPAAWPIVVFGAGHLAQCVVPLLLTLQCRVTWVDPREEWLARGADHARLEKVCTDDMPGVVEAQPDGAFFVLMTRGHASDLPVLAQVLETRDAPFVGVIGSARKADVLRRDLRERGLAEAKVESFFCPLGLPIGDNTPPEIAISVVAQLLQVRDGATVP